MEAVTLQGYKRNFDLCAGSSSWGEYGRGLPELIWLMLGMWPYLLMECKWTASYEIRGHK